MIFDHAKEHDKFLEAESSVEQMIANRNECDRQGLSTPSQQTDLGRFASTSSNNYLMNLPVDSSFLFDSEEDEDDIMSYAENARRSELEIITRDIFDYDVLESEVNVDSILDGKQKEAKHLIEHELSMNGEDANIATNKDHKAESCDLDSSPSHGDKRISENKHFSGLSGDDHSGKHFLATPRTPDPDENHSSSPIPWSPIPPSFQETFEKQNAVLRNQTNQPLWKDDDFAVDTDVLEYLTVPSLDKHADDGTKKALKRLTTQTASHEETENKIYTGSKTGTMIKHVAPPSRQNCEVGNSSKEHSEEGESCEGGSWGDSSNRMEEEEKYKSLRPRQSGQWFYMFDQLRAFQKNHGHCSVPYGFSPNEQLARWVKRQRYQYKLMKEGKKSTMTGQRAQALQTMGFVWNSQGSTWSERFQELRNYQDQFGDCHVPGYYAPNPSLAVWVKSQRRQYNLYLQGKPSTMTEGRIRDLNSLGFSWQNPFRKNHSAKRRRIGSDQK